MKVSYFHSSADIVVIGHNSEMADIDNPNGEILGFASYVYATSPSGDRCRKFVKTSQNEQEALAPATKMADALNVRLTQGKLPVGFASWDVANPEYGSFAYMSDVQEQYESFDPSNPHSDNLFAM